ncbi:MAG: lipocalin family protein [Thiobacillus sp.]
MKSVLHLVGIAAAVLPAACASTPPPLATVQTVDLDRYYGTWHEIARLPNRFQAKCVSDTKATYRPYGNGVKVVNQCRTASGTLEQADGIARVVPGSQGARLRVSFFHPFYGDYWILDLDPDYRWVLVGEPGRHYAWILAREPKLDAATLEALLSRAAALGFDRQAFIRTPQASAVR